jgi:hypothetical protein
MWDIYITSSEEGRSRHAVRRRDGLLIKAARVHN